MIGILFLIFVIVAVIFLVNSYQNKYQSFQGVVFNVIVVIFLLFLVFSSIYVYKNYDTNLTSFEGVVNFAKIYFVWVGHFFSNAGNSVGYVVKQDWGGNITS